MSNNCRHMLACIGISKSFSYHVVFFDDWNWCQLFPFWYYLAFLCYSQEVECFLELPLFPWKKNIFLFLNKLLVCRCLHSHCMMIITLVLLCFKIFCCEIYRQFFIWFWQMLRKEMILEWKLEANFQIKFLYACLLRFSLSHWHAFFHFSCVITFEFGLNISSNNSNCNFVLS